MLHVAGFPTATIMRHCSTLHAARRAGQIVISIANLAMSVLGVMQAATGEGMTEEERKQKQQKAMADPEIQNILTDPIMR